jgi:hypothetical protein
MPELNNYRSIQCEIIPLDKVLNEGEVLISFELQNTSNYEVRVLKWQTPLEGLLTDCLDINVQGKKIPFDGKMIKRGNPSEKDFILLKPGETVKKEIDLTEAYDIPEKAEIQIEFNPERLVLLNDGKEIFNPKKISENSLQDVEVINHGALLVTERLNKKLTFGEQNRATDKKKVNENELIVSAGLKPPVFMGGTAQSQQIVLNAHREAYRLVNEAIRDLQNNVRPKFIEWFDVNDSQLRVNKVLQNFKAVKTRMENLSFTYDLSGSGCESNVYAYTTKGGKRIWLCDVFWTVSPTGVNSQAGTLVHEHSHASANTDDHQYGEDGCRKLAISNPDKAITNADNHEYYAES